MVITCCFESIFILFFLWFLTELKTNKYASTFPKYSVSFDKLENNEEYPKGFSYSFRDHSGRLLEYKFIQNTNNFETIVYINDAFGVNEIDHQAVCLL